MFEQIFMSRRLWPLEQTGPLLRSVHFGEHMDQRQTGLGVISQDYGMKDIHGPPLLLAATSSHCLCAAATPALEDPLVLRSTLPWVPLTTVS